MITRRSLLRGSGAASLLALGALSAGCTAPSSLVGETDVAHLPEWDARLTELAEYSRDRVPGFVVSHMSGASENWTKVRGVRSVADNVPLTSDTVFQVASLTKPLVAAVVMRLQERGEIDLDTPLLDYADYSDVGSGPEASLVTPRLVLSHRTGLPNWRTLEHGQTVPFLSRPGEQHGYSGEGFIWLQVTLESLTGKSLHQLMREEIFEPLIMQKSALGYDVQKFGTDDFARGHDENAQLIGDGKVKQVADAFIEQGYTLDELGILAAREAISSSEALSDLFYDHPTFAPGTASGSLVCTASDYLRFMEVFIAPDRQTLLQRESITEMLTPHIQIKRLTSAGLGWQLEQTSTGLAFSHGGFNTGFKSYALGRPDVGKAAVLLTNSNEGNRLRWPIINGLTQAGEADILG